MSQAGFYSFLMAVVFLATALVAYVTVTKSEFFKYYNGENFDLGEGEGDTKIEEGKLVDNGKVEVVSPRYSEDGICFFALVPIYLS